MKVLLPIPIHSVANKTPPTARGARAQAAAQKTLRDTTERVLWECQKPPQHARYVVTLTRISPRELDGDNWQRAAKPVRDAVADYLLPHNRSNGRRTWADDSDGRITWLYTQEKGEPGCRIDIQPAETATCPTCHQELPS